MTATWMHLDTVPEHLADVRAPAGATEIAEWDELRTESGAEYTRVFRHAPVDTLEAVLTLQGVQYGNGTVHRSIVIRINPTFEGEDEVDVTPQVARRLAALLQNFADTCEILDGVER